MSNLQYWENKMKERRKKTTFRDFIKEIASWFTITLHRNQDIISRYPDTERIRNIIEPSSYLKEYGDGVNGISYNFDCSFSENLSKVFVNVPKMATIKYGKNENCNFTDTVYGAKNSYLSICIGEEAENILHSIMSYDRVFNIFESALVVSNSENIFHCFQVSESFQIFYSRYIANSNAIWFSTNLIGCQECIFCDNLQNQTYCIHNKPLDKEVYFQEKSKILQEKKKFIDYSKMRGILSKNKLAPQCTGSGIYFSENIENGLMVTHTTNSRNIAFITGMPVSDRLYDCFDIGDGSDMYGWMGSGHSSNIYLGANANLCNSIYYSYFLDSCSFCLGCVGLKNKSFCILNKQYTKEEWYKLAGRIFAQMDQDGTLGEFFPGSINPFYFNDTIAYLIDDSFTKEEVEKDGYMWREEKIRIDIPKGAEIITPNELDTYQGYDTAGAWNINPDIMKKVIMDTNGDYYRIVPIEYDFLMRYGLPLPEIHWLERIKMGFQFL